MITKKYQLKNGLNVLLLESHKSPVVSVQMWVKTGSADEQKGVEGISHFIEHLVFKGTPDYGVGEIAAAVEGSGGELNAYTSMDQTVFYVTISEQYTDTALNVISQMMGFPTFDPKEVNNEREVVIEEIKRGLDNPGRKSSQLLFSTLYKKHPYGKPVIGYESIIKKVSVKKIMEYYQSRYVPENMFLVIAGNFESKAMKTKVEKYFSDFKNYKLKKVVRKKEPKQNENRIKVETTEFKSTTGHIAWKVPSIEHHDIAALEVMTMILGSGDSSRLVHRLRIENPVVNSVTAFVYPMQDQGILGISYQIEKDKLEIVLEQIQDEIRKMIEIPPSPEEMQKALTNLASHEIYSLETVDNIARKAGSYEFYMNDYDYFKKYLKQVNQLQPVDIQKVAKKYFTQKGMTLTLMTDGEKKKSEAALKQFVKKWTKAKFKIQPRARVFKPKKFQLPKSSSQSRIHVEKAKLNNGLTVYFAPQKDTPVIALKSAFMGGVRQEPQGKGGLIELLSRTWLSETQSKSEFQINQMIDQMAAGISPYSGRNTIGLGAEYLKMFETEMVDLFIEVLTQPKFTDEVIQREKMMMLNQLKKRKDNPAQLAMLQLMQKMYEGHPYAKDMMGSEESLNQIVQKDLIEIYQKMIQTANAHICLVGDYHHESMIKKFEKIHDLIPKGQIHKDHFQIKKLNKDVELYQFADKEQSHVVVAYQSINIQSPKRFALDIISSVLSGQGGRLFVELRDKNSLAYSVSPIQMSGIEGGHFGAYIGCSPDKVKKALEMINIEFMKLVEQPLSNDELERAKKYLIGRHDIDLQRKSSICNTILFDEIYGNSWEQGLFVADHYNRVTAKDVQDLAKELFSQHKIISIVGKI